jgi:hypothetical protein
MTMNEADILAGVSIFSNIKKEDLQAEAERPRI